MNLFELSMVMSPICGAVGAYVAVSRTSPWAPGWLWLTIPFGMVFGIGCFYAQLRLAIGPHNKHPDLPRWRAAAVMGVGFAGPYLAGLLSYLVIRGLLAMAT
jgi:hypothetical protein